MTKHDKLNYLGKRLENGDSICAYDEEILEYFDCSNKTLERYLKELQSDYPQIETKVIDKKTYYHLSTKVSTLIHKYLTTSDDMTWLIQIINDADKNLLAELEDETKERLENILSSEKDIFLYQNSPFEVFETPKGQQIFRALKSAVQSNEYRDIFYSYNNPTLLKELKCLKLIFMENNWYVAVATQEKQLLFLRISFIEKIEYSSKKSTYQPTQINQYIDFFKHFQNSMSLYGVERQEAHILASPKVAKYFQPYMKRHLNSQKFIERYADGSIEFTLEYTQAIEILPFIKKWLPDLKILSPKSLEDDLRKDLEAYLLR